jgi:hypothetical protein
MTNDFIIFISGEIKQQIGTINYGPTKGMIEYKNGSIVKNYKDITEISSEFGR